MALGPFHSEEEEEEEEEEKEEEEEDFFYWLAENLLTLSRVVLES